MTPEGQIRNAICSWLSYQKCLFWISDRVGIYDPTRKQFRSNKNPYRIKGISDILGIWQGKLLAIEVKVPKKYPSPEQREFLARVNQHGGIGFVARSIEDVKNHLDQHYQHRLSTALNAAERVELFGSLAIQGGCLFVSPGEDSEK